MNKFWLSRLHTHSSHSVSEWQQSNELIDHASISIFDNIAGTAYLNNTEESSRMGTSTNTSGIVKTRSKSGCERSLATHNKRVNSFIKEVKQTGDGNKTHFGVRHASARYSFDHDSIVEHSKSPVAPERGTISPIHLARGTRHSMSMTQPVSVSSKNKEKVVEEPEGPNIPAFTQNKPIGFPASGKPPKPRSQSVFRKQSNKNRVSSP